MTPLQWENHQTCVIGRSDDGARFIIGWDRLQNGKTGRVLRIFDRNAVLVRRVPVKSVNDGKMKARMWRGQTAA